MSCPGLLCPLFMTRTADRVGGMDSCRKKIGRRELRIGVPKPWLERRKEFELRRR